jgi:dTDP-4-amino-4,6-dideoxygalactose transaminase
MSAAATVVSLPVGEHLTDADVAQVVDAVRSFPA